MDALPSELVMNMVGYLNPADRWRLSATSQRYRGLLPVWLRIRILSPSSCSSLKANFYVSSADTPDQPLHFYPSETEDTEHTAPDTMLQYGIEYLFWTYDYERENHVYLGRHGQKLLYQEDPHFLYTLGLRPKAPNQTWTIVTKKGIFERATNNDVEDNVPGEHVPYASSICLTIGGQHPKPYRPDSSTRLYLSAHTLSMGALWYAIHDKEWCADEELQILRSADYEATTSSHSERTKDCEGIPIENVDPEEDENVEPNRTGLISERDVVIHAIPEILDGGYSLYSPEGLKSGEATCALHHATIPCNYWIEDGFLMFHAIASLDFKFAVPILEEDQVDHAAPQVEPLSILLKKNSSRWWAIKHYMSTAADVEDGRDFQMESFLRNSKDHEDHTIIYDDEKKLVKISVKDAVVDGAFPNVPYDKDAVWKFLLCG